MLKRKVNFSFRKTASPYSFRIHPTNDQNYLVLHLAPFAILFANTLTLAPYALRAFHSPFPNFTHKLRFIFGYISIYLAGVAGPSEQIERAKPSQI